MEELLKQLLEGQTRLENKITNTQPLSALLIL